MRCLHTNQSKQQKAEVLRELAEGNVSVLLLSPEALESGSFCGELGIPQLLGRLPPIVFACIDEAHCILEWSHNFRHSYFRIQKVHVHPNHTHFFQQSLKYYILDRGNKTISL